MHATLSIKSAYTPPLKLLYLAFSMPITFCSFSSVSTGEQLKMVDFSPPQRIELNSPHGWQTLKWSLPSLELINAQSQSLHPQIQCAPHSWCRKRCRCGLFQLALMIPFQARFYKCSPFSHLRSGASHQTGVSSIAMMTLDRERLERRGIIVNYVAVCIWKKLKSICRETGGGHWIQNLFWSRGLVPSKGQKWSKKKIKCKGTVEQKYDG